MTNAEKSLVASHVASLIDGGKYVKATLYPEKKCKVHLHDMFGGVSYDVTVVQSWAGNYLAKYQGEQIAAGLTERAALRDASEALRLMQKR